MISIVRGRRRPEQQAFEKELIAVGGDRSPAPDETAADHLCLPRNGCLPRYGLPMPISCGGIDLAGQSPGAGRVQALQITQNNLTVRVPGAAGVTDGLEQTWGPFAKCTKRWMDGALRLRAEGRARAIVTLGWPHFLVCSLAGAKKVHWQGPYCTN